MPDCDFGDPLLQVLSELAPYLRRHTRQYLLGTVAVVMTALFITATPRVLALAIDALRSGGAGNGELRRYGLTIALLALSAAVFNLMQRRQMIVASRQIEAELRHDLFSRLTTLDRAFYDRSRTGDLMNLMTSDLATVREVLGPGFNMGSRVTLIAVGALIGMLALQPALGALIAVAVPALIVVAALLRRRVSQRFQEAQAKLSDIAARAQENFAGARLVRGYALEEREQRGFDDLNEEYVQLNLSLARVEAALPAVMGLLMAAAWLAILLIGGRLVIFGAGLSVGEYVAFTSYLALLAGPVVDFGRLLNIYQRGVTSWERLRRLLDARPLVRDSGRTDFSITGVQGDIEFRNVTLSIDGAQLLCGVNLRVPRGSSLGITGRTGSGKSLVAALIARQLDPTGGRVLIDGQDARELPLLVLRENIGFVPQEPFLFSDTLSENIAFGLPEARSLDEERALPMERVRWASGVAALEREVAKFPGQYDTLLGERGVTLSGGQRQRTAIARAVARQPRILILDDALSAVDTRTERRLLANLRELLHERTVLLVSHRVSALQHLDQIVVLDEGRVAEQGTHEELLARGGLYAELQRLQATSGGPGEEAEPV
ncbi:ABC-type multidrug transport system, ATPase and permease component [Deinococcus peraridilitoris DSM 19664]|uniref:ABC-type multidrug transport system, ATPase and permease component n=1 Tax=Deinococcus peraridilitoris (strain DSM 19664 / LMG 22246 / CIP 109416 / KR-200) TaxID=937777 RepID=L0A1H0_DEIPD|nr:ABC-type multidrug transport system, ATPase and permease component [Deinococcus peraridilitoris DSM 19664]